MKSITINTQITVEAETNVEAMLIVERIVQDANSIPEMRKERDELRKFYERWKDEVHLIAKLTKERDAALALLESIAEDHEVMEIMADNDKADIKEVLSYLLPPPPSNENAIEVREPDDDGETGTMNFYECPACKEEWQDEWGCEVDDDCPSCGCRHISPYKSEPVK